MKENIHPQWYPEAKAVCSCGNSWVVGSTIEVVRTDVCNACHPFFTGEQRIVDTEGQVDRFYQRLEKRAQIQAEAQAREEALASGLTPLEELELPGRATKLLVESGYETVADVISQLDQDEDELLAIVGFGQKSLIDLKKRLRAGSFIK
jgi:large subunit ribosomal protein L31